MLPENWSADDVRVDPVGETTHRSSLRNPLNANYLLIFWSEFVIASRDSAEVVHFGSKKSAR
jgi:hypothetical protein